jgi:RND superfamily putative drug exporter
VDALVIVAVFLVLLVLLRRPLLAVYLIFTVLFGYLTTLGLTNLFFERLQPGAFPGLDWRVPLFLFTILVAVGQDYNIFLMTRVREEEARRGTVAGVTAALGKTGGVLTSCGVIMAGTFATLFAAPLWEMWQMGFALSCGVLLDALVVRPVLVPAYLLIWARPDPRPLPVA